MRKLSFTNIFFFTVLVVILVCLVSLVVLGNSLFGGKGGFPNLKTATMVSQTFVESIHSGNIELAYSMLSEKFAPHITLEQFEALIELDSQIFKNYTNLNICDWGIYYSNGIVIDEKGLLYYGNGAIVVQIALHKDSDSVWRVQGFHFDTNIDPQPFGLCS